MELERSELSKCIREKIFLDHGTWSMRSSYLKWSMGFFSLHLYYRFHSNNRIFESDRILKDVNQKVELLGVYEMRT